MCEHIVDELNAILTHVACNMAAANGFVEGDINSGLMTERIKKIVFGFEHFNAGTDLKEIPETEPLVRASAAFAQHACSMAFVNMGKLDVPKTAEAIRFLLNQSASTRPNATA